jgi:hypothetical protein
MYDNLLANVPTDLWIGGKWRKSSDGGRFDVIDPATENKVASVASATVEDAKAALDAAGAAFPGWAAKKPRERGEILRKSFELIMRDAERWRSSSPSRTARLCRIRAARSPMPRNSSAGLPKRRCATSAKIRWRRRRARASWCSTSRQASRCW